MGVNRYMAQQESTISWESTKKLHSKRGKGKGKSKRRKSSSDEAEAPVAHQVLYSDVLGFIVSLTEIAIFQVNRDVGEMPEGAKSTDDEGETRKTMAGYSKAGGGEDVYKALDIDLDEPLKDEERLPVRTHRMAAPAALLDEERLDKTTSKSKTKSSTTHRHKEKDKEKLEEKGNK